MATVKPITTPSCLSLESGPIEAKPCHLSKLPPELQLKILNYLQDRHDIYQAAKTCKWMEELLLYRMYEKVEIELPKDGDAAWCTGNFLSLRSHVIKAIQHLTIKQENVLHSVTRDYKHRLSNVDCTQAYLQHLVKNIPGGRLQSLSFKHRVALPMQMFVLLVKAHGLSLKHLSFFELEPACAFLPLSKLKSLECSSIDSEGTLARLICDNKSSLEILTIGQEKELLHQYYQDGCTYLNQDPAPLVLMRSIIDFSHLSQLKDLSLIGVDATVVVPHSLIDSFYLARLHSLKLESCKGSTEFFGAMASTFRFLQSDDAAEIQTTPMLRKFLFRQESLNITLKETLVQFLNAFSGLETISILIENASVLERIPNLIGRHGATLTRLVLESRIQPRKLLRLNTSRPFGHGGHSAQLWEESLNDICSSCPNLIELGMGFSWMDETLRLRNPPLSDLVNLKVVHLRNFPETNMLQMRDETMKEHVTRFVEWIHPDAVSEQPPQLETVSIGPILYETRYKGSNPTRNAIPEWLRTHHFMVDWARTRFGRWSAMISPVSERYLKEFRQERELGGIFEQVWLK